MLAAMARRLSRRTLIRDGALAFGAAAVGGGALGELSAAATRSRPSAAALRELARQTSGPVLTPASSRYASASRVAQGAVRPRPAAVVQARDVRDVQATLRWGARRDVQIVPRSGGHGFAGWAGGDPSTVVVDLSRLRQVGVDGGEAVVGPARS